MKAIRDDHHTHRLVTHAQFLVREFFPGHDDLCRAEGELMPAYAGGRKDAAGEQLAELKGRAAGYMARCFSARDGL